jgi:hypothetical protein
MRVNWKPGTWWYGSSKVTIPPGSMVTSVENLSQSAGSSIKQVRGCLKYLRAADVAAIRTTNRYTMITVLNWKSYQAAEEAEGKPCAKPDGEPRAESGQSDGKVRATIKESDQGIIREGNQKDKADDSSAFRKVSEKAQESGVQFPSTLPSGRQTPIGLTPAKTIARALQGRLASFEDINSLKEEMAAIKGELPTQSAVASVLGALGDSPSLASLSIFAVLAADTGQGVIGRCMHGGGSQRARHVMRRCPTSRSSVRSLAHADMERLMERARNVFRKWSLTA